MKIKRFILGNIESNCYIISNEKNEAFIIDPGFENQVLIPYLIEHHLKLKGIYLTHGHFDHWGGLKQLTSYDNDVLVFAPLKDKIWFELTPYNYYHYEPTITKWVTHEDTLDVVGYPFTVLETPGHSKGSTVLCYHDICFAGDTIFKESIGRTDLPFASFDDIKSSILMLYDHLEDQTILYPGHGDETTIAHEKKFNPFVRKK